MEYYIGIALMLLIVIYFKSPLGKGIIGEFVLKLLMGKNRPQKDTFVIHKLRFYDGTKSLEISHIIVNQSGVHMIETVNEIGKVYGSEKDKYWKNKQFFDPLEKSLPNPIKELNQKAKSLKQVMPKQSALHTYIVFTGRAKNKVKSEQTPIVYPFGLFRQLKKHAKDEYLMKAMDVRKVYEGLKNLRLMNKSGYKEEVQPFNHSKVYQKNR
ncbi:MAG: nuclease-related domain-containing protein [Acholeplasmataceae bacterium]|jgi:hypothetical protein|nr:nuclease-related domain-containing protein [Acholeplasmataceae bacterium]